MNESVEAEETERLRSYLAAGGTVLVLGDHEGPGFSEADFAYDEMLEALGSTIQIDDDSLDEGPYETFDVEPSPLTSGVGVLGYNWMSSLSVGEGAEALALSEYNFGVLLAAQHLDGGTLIVSGDSNMFSDNSYGAYEVDDNGLLAHNLCS